MAQTFITMTHPEIPGQVATASEKAFDEIWSDKGWEKVDVEVLDLADQAAARPLEELKRDDLLAVMTAEGVAVPPGRPSNADLVSAISDHREAQEG